MFSHILLKKAAHSNNTNTKSGSDYQATSTSVTKRTLFFVQTVFLFLPLIWEMQQSALFICVTWFRFLLACSVAFPIKKSGKYSNWMTKIQLIQHNWTLLNSGVFYSGGGRVLNWQPGWHLNGQKSGHRLTLHNFICVARLFIVVLTPQDCLVARYETTCSSIPLVW